jgi:tetraacyldisaccharide 4'-kinase
MALLKAHPQVDVIVCDDGLQHLALQRQIAIAIFDERRAGNGWLLPAGLLREPWPWQQPHPLDAILLTQPSSESSAPMQPLDGAGSTPTFAARKVLSTVGRNALGKVQTLHSLAAVAPLSACAGIAKPSVFFDMLKAQGLELAQTQAWPDHCHFELMHLQRLHHINPHAVWLTTEKDAVKLFALLAKAWQSHDRDSVPQPHQVWSIGLDLQIDPAFFATIDTLLAHRPRHDT